MPHSAPRRGVRVAALLALGVAAASVVVTRDVNAQSAAPAAAFVSTPAGALPSIGLGALGSERLTVGIRYGRLTDRYFIQADELSEEGTESFERDVYAAELSIGLLGGSVRLQGGRSHARYIYQRADTLEIASPHGVLASVGFARELLSLGAGPVRFGIGSDLSGGWADLSGESAMSAQGQLPISLRFTGASTGLAAWAAPGMAWGALRGETGTLTTASAGLRLELPTGTAVDLAATQLMGDQEAVWGGNRARLSIGISHGFGGGGNRDRAQDPPGYRPRYSAGAQNDRSDAKAESERSRRPRPRTMPRDGEPTAQTQADAPKPEAGVPAQIADASAQQPELPPTGQRHPAALPDRPARQAPVQPRATDKNPGQSAKATPAREAAPVNGGGAANRAQPAEPAAPTQGNAEAGRAQPATPATPASPAPAAPASTDRRTIFYADEAPSPQQPARSAEVPAATAAPSPASVSRAEPAARPAPASPAPARSAPARSGGRFTVQAAAVKTNAEAEEMRDSLSVAGFPARIFSGPDYFRIRVGRFTTRAAAEAFANRMRVEGFEAWVTTTEGEG